MPALRLALAAALAAMAAGHGSMITPAPRSAHGQKYDAANKCACKDTGDCYSNITGVAQYCGLGCLGEAWLYYQVRPPPLPTVSSHSQHAAGPNWRGRSP